MGMKLVHTLFSLKIDHYIDAFLQRYEEFEQCETEELLHDSINSALFEKTHWNFTHFSKGIDSASILRAQTLHHWDLHKKNDV